MLRSSAYFLPEHVTKFVEAYDDRCDGVLQSTLNKFKESNAQIQALQVLRAMIKKNPDINRENLQKKLTYLKLDAAAKK